MRASTILAACAASLLLGARSSASELYAQPGPKLSPSDGGADWRFGQSVALDGERLAVGAPGATATPATGTVYVFRLEGASWVQEARLDSPHGASDFGNGVALDGDTLAVSSHSGTVDVFVRAGASWTHQATLVPPPPDSGGDFGSGLALAGDLLLVGAQFMNDTGAVYAFERGGGTWTSTARIVPADAQAGDGFSISLSLWGDTLACGARFDDDAGPDRGSAYVFRRVGASWVQQAKLLPPPGAFAYWGEKLSLRGDRLVVGNDAYAESWRREGGLWSLEAEIPTPAYASRALLLGDDVLVVGDWLAGGGRVHLLHFEHGAWVELAELSAFDEAPGDGFGLGFALDGQRLLVGARDDDDLGAQSGSAYSFDLYGSLAYGTELEGSNIATLLTLGEPRSGSELRFEVAGFSGVPPVYVLASPSSALLPFGNGTLLVGEPRVLLGRILLEAGAGSRDLLLPWAPGTRTFVQGVQRHPQYPGRVALSHGVQLVLAP